jgi:hypothetical protein
MRASATSLLLLLTICVAAGQAFGRFGYYDVPEIPGFTVDKNGFVPKFGASERFNFVEPAPKWTVKSATDLEETIDLGKGAGPSTLKVDLLAPGFMLRFPKGFALKLKSTSSPFLSWKEASVGEHVPTPSVRWIAVSFKGGQPPLVFGFLDSEVSLRIDGQVGDWTLRTQEPYTGWVRIALPNGTQPIATDSAATLGKLSNSVADLNELWWQAAPKLKELQIKDEETAVEATWVFDRKGAVVPVAAVMAPLGKYPLTLYSKVQRLPGHTSEGPTTICLEDTLRIRFPVNRVPLGRAITIGAPTTTPIGTVSAFDIAGVVELAFENLVSSRDVQTRKTADSTVSEFIQSAQYTVEPHTSQSLPYPETGAGMDLVAANALLYQAYSMSTKSTSNGNTLLASVGSRRDWYTWRIWGAEDKVARRTGALAAIAGALCPEPERRLEAAMMQAGLAGQRGLGIYFERLVGSTLEPPYLEPVWDVRNTLFFMVHSPRRASPFAASLMGRLRVFGDTPVRCVARDSGTDAELTWTDADVVTLASGFPIQVTGDSISTQHTLGYTIVRAGDPLKRLSTLVLPPWVSALPKFVAPPRYDEPIG